MRLRRRTLHFLATVLAGIAVLVVNTASWLYVHQPETPDELLK
ncbi:cyclic lactone autoinducer peptide [Paenibacillus aurantiacus]|uniref:Cyclic lactone autoinducer peptide n=1 Tax=Paenibacillus aurantiacus TaxID=1936118 RepID=A0ABV5KKG1_9BACL